MMLAEDLNVQPTHHARQLVSGQSRTLGLIISDICNPFFSDLFKSIDGRALEIGYEVIVRNTNHEPKKVATRTTSDGVSIRRHYCHEDRT
jgi:LacI family transcriptional regulator